MNSKLLKAFLSETTQKTVIVTNRRCKLCYLMSAPETLSSRNLCIHCREHLAALKNFKKWHSGGGRGMSLREARLWNLWSKARLFSRRADAKGFPKLWMRLENRATRFCNEAMAESRRNKEQEGIYPANPTLTIGNRTIVNPTEEDFEEALEAGAQLAVTCDGQIFEAMEGRR